MTKRAKKPSTVTPTDSSQAAPARITREFLQNEIAGLTQQRENHIAQANSAGGAIAALQTILNMTGPTAGVTEISQEDMDKAKADYEARFKDQMGKVENPEAQDDERPKGDLPPAPVKPSKKPARKKK